MLNTLLVAVISVVLVILPGPDDRRRPALAQLADLAPSLCLCGGAAQYPHCSCSCSSVFVVPRPLPGPRQSFHIGSIVFLNNRGPPLPDLRITNVGAFALAAVQTPIALAARFTWPSTGAAPARCRPGVTRRRIGPSPAGMTLARTPPGLQSHRRHPRVPSWSAFVLALTLSQRRLCRRDRRAGLQSVPRGQVEAARAIGLSRFDALRFVVLPQALRRIAPPLTNQVTACLLASCLRGRVSPIPSVSVFTVSVPAQTGQAVEILSLTMGVYLWISLLTAGWLGWFNAGYPPPLRA